MRAPRNLLLLLAVLATVALAGCGGGEVEPDEVPGGPVTLTVPTDPDAGASGPADGDTATDDAAADDEAAEDTTSSTGTGTGTDTTASAPAADPTAVPTTAPTAAPTTGGTGTTTDGPTNDTPPPDGSAPQQFEDFCEQNAGAC